MALYVSVGTRRRRALVAIVVAALLAFGLGWLIGRQQVPSVEQRVTDVRQAAAEIATGIERLDIEYEQVLNGDDTVQGGVIETLDGLRSDLIATMDDAPWIASATRAALLDSLAAVESAVNATAPLPDVQLALTDAATQVRTAFATT
jgi:hypothetical protein